jgi:hypothetical protein
MPASLVQRAIEQARSRDPWVKALALLYGSRVLAAVDNEAARQAFDEGVATAESQRIFDGHIVDHLLCDAVRLGARVDPASAVILFRCLRARDGDPRIMFVGSQLVQALAQSGDFENAVRLLEDPKCEAGGAGAVLHFAFDPVLQRRAMWAARTRWRELRRREGPVRNHFAYQEFYHLFSLHWRKLPPAEQEAWLDEILQALAADPGQAMGGQIAEGVALRTTQDLYLFLMLSAIHTLKPPAQVEAILRAHPDVAAAAKVYPRGVESVAATRGRPRPEGRLGGFVGSIPGSNRGLGEPSAVPELLEEAHQLYRDDKDPENPNRAPHVFWPSCHAYKTAMYWAGKKSGKEAEPLLAEILDPDFALLASIELAAGALGLPQEWGVQMGRHRRRSDERRNRL